MVVDRGDPTSGTDRRRTSTRAFGSSSRESHDSSPFYSRFATPTTSDSEHVQRVPPELMDTFHLGDSRDMSVVPDDSVALVVTSPPYFAGKEYELDVTSGRAPRTYHEYLHLLEDVFAECARVLEPGGRIAVNVANLGRRPYRSLASDVMGLLQDLGLLLRGEIVWVKAKGAAGSCAWGSFQSAVNPVLRDVTERIVVACKGRFDRAIDPRRRRAAGLPHRSTITKDEFLEATTDLWEIPPASATRIGHPAPFPVELPQRLIELYTFEEDVVLDPFVGSGSTAVAAVRTGRHFVGFDTEAEYLRIAAERVNAERRRVGEAHVPGVRGHGEDAPDEWVEALRCGARASELARIVLTLGGFEEIRHEVRLPGSGVTADITAADPLGRTWVFALCGSMTAVNGARLAESLWRAAALASLVRRTGAAAGFVILTTSTPTLGGEAWRAVAALSSPEGPIDGIVDLTDPGAPATLRSIVP
ncbi:MAG: hypothetical protein KatS3mg008_0665 [Acidimicrobiales bacterium]|nr:MAG: hypothetical protein KatS3mg008_0665 [Acidimicrobiales bacterium]